MSAPIASTGIEPLVVSAGGSRMTIHPALGARILAFDQGGKNILLEASAVAGTENSNNFGATFWPSPQSAWGWPPIAAIDNEPYAVAEHHGNLALTSSTGRLLDESCVTLSKIFAPVPEKSAIDVTYVINNVGEKPATLAAWQIARVRAGGLTFFRLGEGGVSSDKLSTVTHGSVQWYQYDAAIVTTQGQKTFADGKGWVAHVEGELLLVQAFPDLPSGAAAAGEAEIELYADPSHTYIEIEPQGRIQTIARGMSSEPWTVRWWLRRLPTGIEAKLGNAALVAFVESLIQS
jgi:hypothetical protein